jgi:hypothetical protein
MYLTWELKKRSYEKNVTVGGSINIQMTVTKYHQIKKDKDEKKI